MRYRLTETVNIVRRAEMSFAFNKELGELPTGSARRDAIIRKAMSDAKFERNQYVWNSKAKRAQTLDSVISDLRFYSEGRARVRYRWAQRREALNAAKLEKALETIRSGFQGLFANDSETPLDTFADDLKAFVGKATAAYADGFDGAMTDKDSQARRREWRRWDAFGQLLENYSFGE